ncbi:MAG: transposase [Verrucomicrobiota bacterium]
MPPKANASFVAAMEDVLEVYALVRNPQRPLVCLDEFCKQLVEETRRPLSARPGNVACHDYEYVRHGSASVFMIYAPLEGVRELFITESATRTRLDYAQALELIATKMFPDAQKIVLVEDNLNTHSDASLYQAFEPAKARDLAARFERHHTPVHGSWLNIAESEIAAVLSSAIDARVASLDDLRHQCSLAQADRNSRQCTTSWNFTNENAREKLFSLYPSTQS